MVFENRVEDVPIRNYSMQIGFHPDPSTAPSGTAVGESVRQAKSTIALAGRTRKVRPDSLFIDGLLLSMAWPNRPPLSPERDLKLVLLEI